VATVTLAEVMATVTKKATVLTIELPNNMDFRVVVLGDNALHVARLLSQQTGVVVFHQEFEVVG
jgi:hypothetical protein